MFGAARPRTPPVDVLPEPASPKISVMVPSSIPPPMSASKAAEPVVICDAGGRHFHLRARRERFGDADSALWASPRDPA